MSFDDEAAEPIVVAEDDDNCCVSQKNDNHQTTTTTLIIYWLCAWLWRNVVELVVWLIVREKIQGLRRDQFRILTSPALCISIDHVQQQSIGATNVSFFVRKRLLRCKQITFATKDEPAQEIQQANNACKTDDPWMVPEKTSRQFEPSYALLSLIYKVRDAMLLAGCTVEVQNVSVQSDAFVFRLYYSTLLLATDQLTLCSERASFLCASETIADARSVQVSFDCCRCDEPHINVQMKSLSLCVVESVSIPALAARFARRNDQTRSLGVGVTCQVQDVVDAKLYAGERCTRALIDRMFVSIDAEGELLDFSFEKASLMHELTESGASVTIFLNRLLFEAHRLCVSSATVSIGNNRMIAKLQFSTDYAIEVIRDESNGNSANQWKIYTSLHIDCKASDAHLLSLCIQSMVEDVGRVSSSFDPVVPEDDKQQQVSIYTLCGFRVVFTLRNDENGNVSLNADLERAQLTTNESRCCSVRIDLSIANLHIADAVERSHFRYVVFFERAVRVLYTRGRHQQSLQIIDLGDKVALCLHYRTMRFFTRCVEQWNSVVVETTTVERDEKSATKTSSLYAPSFDILFNYKPEPVARTVGNIIAENGRFAYALGSVPIEDAALRYSAVDVRGSSESLSDLLLQAYIPEWERLGVSLFTGVQPLRIAINLGDAVLDIVRLPLQTMLDGGASGDVALSSAQSMQSVAIELLSLGSRIGTVGYKALGGKRLPAKGDDEFNDEIGGSCDSGNSGGSGSMSSCQPRNFGDGKREAWRVLRENCASAVFSVTSDVARAYTHSDGSASATAVAVARGIPRLVTRPIAGVAGALVKLSQGAKNKIDAREKQKSDRKWR